MAFKNRKFAKRVISNPCEWCGWQSSSRHAAHIIDEIKGAAGWNALSLCPNCHSVFEDRIRPKLYKALKEFKVKGLPKSWAKSNKIS
ncbi:MAG: hypothetical protein WC369_01545 [Dehalococcoidales bacterium]|jgi:hypothetical protein